MQYKRQLLLAFALVILATNSVFSQKREINRIDSLMRYYNQSGAFNGNILVAKKNHIIYHESFGFTNADKKERLTLEYRFNIGSITKEFSGVALMQLQEKGRLKLSDSIYKYIPELPIWSKKVRVTDLLQYTSGIPNVNWKQVKNDEDILNDLKKLDSLNFKPGTNYDYNNDNIFLRHFIVERLTGMPFKAYAEKYIFKTCGMKSSVMTPVGEGKYIAKGFNSSMIADKPDLPITGGTYLTTYELYRWSKCINSNKLITKNSTFELGKHFNLPETQSPLGITEFEGIKLAKHSHDGRAGSYEAILVSNLNENFTIILLGNNYNGKTMEISDKIASILESPK